MKTPCPYPTPSPPPGTLPSPQPPGTPPGVPLFPSCPSVIILWKERGGTMGPSSNPQVTTGRIGYIGPLPG